MRIIIKTNDGKRIKIPLPMWLIRFGLSKPFIRFVSKRIKGKWKGKGEKYLTNIDFHALSKELKVLKKYKGLKILDVKSSTGELVEIKI